MISIVNVVIRLGVGLIKLKIVLKKKKEKMCGSCVLFLFFLSYVWQHFEGAFRRTHEMKWYVQMGVAFALQSG